MKIESNIPKGITELFVYNEEDKMYYNQFGLKRKSVLSFETIFCEWGNYFFDISNDNVLNIYCIKVEKNSDVIIFDKELFGSFVYNEDYDELFCEDNNMQVRYMFKSLNYNKQIVYQFVQNMYVKNKFADWLLDNKIYCLDENAINILLIYYYKVNKYFPVLIENGLNGYVEDMFNGNINSETLEKKITKNIIFIAKNAKINVVYAIKLVEKYNFNDLNMLIKLLKHINCLDERVFEELCFMDGLNLCGFLNYFVKALFVLDIIPISSNCIPPVGVHSVRNFFSLYRDYFNLVSIEEDADLYPDNLSIAHDAAIERRNYMQKKSNYENIEESFSNAVKEYSYLACKIDGFDDFEVVVPKNPYDLVQEGKILHHCVESYIHTVSNKNTKICMIRKDKEPYMTVEIRGEEICQAKKKFNALPTSDDEKMLKQWCLQKKLTIVNY